MREFASVAFVVVDLDWERYVVVDPRYYRPAEEHMLVGDSSKARARLNWGPKFHFEELVRRMVNDDLQRLGA